MQDQRCEGTRAGVGSAGHTRLELKQLRPWEQSDSAAGRFWVDLDIRD
jgi:hypothetical protein